MTTAAMYAKKEERDEVIIKPQRDTINVAHMPTLSQGFQLQTPANTMGSAITRYAAYRNVLQK
jgi:hypothetical protein